MVFVSIIWFCIFLGHDFIYSQCSFFLFEEAITSKQITYYVYTRKRPVFGITNNESCETIFIHWWNNIHTLPLIFICEWSIRKKNKFYLFIESLNFSKYSFVNDEIGNSFKIEPLSFKKINLKMNCMKVEVPWNAFRNKLLITCFTVSTMYEVLCTEVLAHICLFLTKCQYSR